MTREARDPKPIIQWEDVIEPPFKKTRQATKRAGKL